MTVLQIPYKESEIIAAVNTYAGKTYFFFPDNTYAEIDECKMQVKYYGYISKDFSGVPSSISQVFRYTIGMLYFFQRDRFFEYSEFSKSLQTSEKINLEKFGLHCPNLSLYEQLKILLSKILAIKSNI